MVVVVVVVVAVAVVVASCEKFRLYLVSHHPICQIYFPHSTLNQVKTGRHRDTTICLDNGFEDVWSDRTG